MGALTLEVVRTSLVMGALIGLPRAASGVFVQGAVTLLITVCLSALVILPFAFFASLGRGCLLPLGAAVLTLILANLAVVAGWGEYFPWSIAGMYAQGLPLSPASV